MSDETKICIDCKWCSTASYPVYDSSAYCRRPRPTRMSPVFGPMPQEILRCEAERLTDLGTCGPEAKFFERRIGLITRIRRAISTLWYGY